MTPCSEHHGHGEFDDADGQLTRGFQQIHESLSSKGGKRSVVSQVSQLTSNDKYSVVDRRSSVTSDKNETGKFGTIGSGVSAFAPEPPMLVKVENTELSREPHNDGTFGNVSFGDHDQNSNCGKLALDGLLKDQQQKQAED